MYDSLSYNTKLLFHPGFLGFEEIRPSWFLFQLGLILSTFVECKNVLKRVCPQLVFVSILATDLRNQIVGFAFIKLEKRLPNGRFLGELGIAVTDEHQGKGVGKKLMSRLISHAVKENVEEINLLTPSFNFKAIGLYKKYGFVECGVAKNRDCWRGLVFECITMSLHLDGKGGEQCEWK
jgi:L-amino acid N-acyltransferase YncA